MYFYLQPFKGFDQNGQAQYNDVYGFSGNPNPTALIGFSTDVSYKKGWLLLTCMAHSVIRFIKYCYERIKYLKYYRWLGNIASNLVGNGESTTNAIRTSTRFLESG